jgi:hypothetical protein
MYVTPETTTVGNLTSGWLKRQFQRVSAGVHLWPSWMRREAGFVQGPDSNNPEVQEAINYTAKLYADRVAEMERELAEIKEAYSTVTHNIEWINREYCDLELRLLETRKELATVARDRDNLRDVLYEMDHGTLARGER